MKKMILGILFLIASISFSQDLVSELNGFKLNQFRKAPTSEFKKPLQKKAFDDGFEFEIFLIKPDSTAYMAFEYASWNKKIIWSIQLYGDDKSLNPDFKNLKMGMTKEEVIKQIGKPSNVKSIGEYGELLEYKDSNYSFEINKKNKLSSIKIMELYLQYYPKPKVSSSFEVILETLKSDDNKKISSILSPGLEIYKGDKTIFFENSWRNEIKNDISGIYSLIRKSIINLDKVDITNVEEYEENIRVTANQNSKRVLKFKKHSKIQEIVLKWELGKYLIWEILLHN